jgi:hypothetical protein
VGKEFSVFEQRVDVPADDGRPALAGPLFGYRLQDYPVDVHLPFKLLGRKLVVDPRNTFARADSIDSLVLIRNAPALRQDGRSG